MTDSKPSGSYPILEAAFAKLLDRLREIRPADTASPHFEEWKTTIIKAAAGHATLQAIDSIMDKEVGGLMEEYQTETGADVDDILGMLKAELVQSQIQEPGHQLMRTLAELEALVQKGTPEQGLDNLKQKQLLPLIKTVKTELRDVLSLPSVGWSRNGDIN